MGSEVLVVGNGTSRLPHHRRLLEMGFEMPLWCCNWAVTEFYRGMVLWHGHKVLRKDIEEYRELVQADFKMSVTEQPFRCPEMFWKDSGSTLLAEAYEQGYETIHIAGFDFGGQDVYSKRPFRQNSAWISRWKLVGHYYRDPKFERVDFIGCESPNRFGRQPNPVEIKKINKLRVKTRMERR